MEWLIRVKNYFLFIVIGVLLITILIKNNTIAKLRNGTSKVEYVYKDSTIFIRDTVLDPKEIFIPDSIFILDTIFKSLIVKRGISKEDSIEIFKSLSRTYIDYSTLKTYEGVIKDDSVAYLKYYNAKVQYNKLRTIDFEFQNRTPYIIKEKVPFKSNDFYIGMDVYPSGIFINGMFKTKKDWYIRAGYDPTNECTLVGGGVKIF